MCILDIYKLVEIILRDIREADAGTEFGFGYIEQARKLMAMDATSYNVEQLKKFDEKWYITEGAEDGK